ncbi:MAG: MoxR family ATPase [Ardenticatenia bacterium]|nr:MoxR family ATPase [Ardenticatenia bacterium]MBK8541153.1 MoxR family ATPase [Ardenticatenia bacterium]
MTSPAPMQPDQFRERVQSIEAEIGRLIVGQTEVVRLVLIALIADGHVLLEGVPGLGKTLLMRTLARVIDGHFQRVQFTPDLMPADILGTMMLYEDADRGRSFRFEPGPVFTNFLLADEINRATPKTQSALLEAMQEATVTVGKQTYPLPRPFFVVATQNPLEMEGTFPLPEAQLDRFAFKLETGYPTVEELVEIVGRTTGDTVPSPGPVADTQMLLAMQQLAREVPIAVEVLTYGARLLRASHPTDPTAPERVRDYARYGASPRALQAMVLGGKIHALLAGRHHVARSDLRALAAPALRHRIVLNFAGQAEGLHPDLLIADIIRQVAE